MGVLSDLRAREQLAARTATTTGSPSRQPASSPPASILNEREFIISVTTAPPAIRMMLLTADYWTNETGDTETEVERLQVVGIETSIRRHWCRRDPPPDCHDQRRYASESEVAKHDYRFRSEEVRHDLLIVSPDFDDAIVPLADLKDSRPNSATYKLVICHWPASEDDARLATIIAKMEDMVTLAAHTKTATVAVAKPAIGKPATAAAAKTSAKSGPRC